MKKILFIGLITLSFYSETIAQSESKNVQSPSKRSAQYGISLEDSILRTANDSISYAFGVSMAQSLKNYSVTEVNPAILSKALMDVLGNRSQPISESQAMLIIQNYLMDKQMQAKNKNKRDGQVFLDSNSKMPGVVTSQSGLQYKIIALGDSTNRPTSNSNVKAHYTGTLLDGTVFDSSKARGVPINFGLNQVIKGWTEGLQHIGKGGRIILYIPPHLAYGERGAGNQIPGNSTLIFDIELVDIVR